MDPNANLEELRQIIARLHGVEIGLGDTEATLEQYADVERLCELFSALDGWLSKGGFLPTSWERGTDPAGYPFARQTGAK